MHQKNIIKLDADFAILLGLLLLSQLFFLNGGYLFICWFTLILLFFYLQRPYGSGIFTIILINHFFQIITSVFQANYLDKDINYRTAENGQAIILSLIGLVFLFLPIGYFQHKLPKVSLDKLRQSANSLSIDKCMYLYIAAFFISSALYGIAFLFPAITQVLISLVKIKWLFFLLFGFVAVLKKEKISYLVVFILLEILLGFFSYFSDFKTVIIYVIILLLSFISYINFRLVLYALLTSIGLVLMALVWTSVKGEYRAFLNSGKGQQKVEVSGDDALNKLYDLSGGVGKSGFDKSILEFLDRLQYTYHFGKAIERVPNVIPYQNGDNWTEVLQFTTTPRFLNPDKPTVDNSVKATRYTGIPYTRASKGVSFSLGYFAECYVDFGTWGMMFPLFIIGWVYGRLYYYFISKSTPNLLFNYAIAASFFMELSAYEMDATHLVGRLFACIVTYLVLIQFAFPWAYRALLVQPENNAVMLNPVY